MSKPAKKNAPKAIAAGVAAAKPPLQPKATTSNDRKETGWQQHSVRGFFAGVVQKKLRLKLNSQKIDGNRIYRIVSAGGTGSNSRRPSRDSA